MTPPNCSPVGWCDSGYHVFRRVGFSCETTIWRAGMVPKVATYVRRIFQLRKQTWARQCLPRPHQVSTEAYCGSVITISELSHITIGFYSLLEM